MNKEDLLQQKIIIWFKNNYQMHKKGLIFAVPNGSTRHIAEALKLKETGLMPGVSDLIVLLPDQKTFFIELKTDIGKQSEAQKDFQYKVELLGFQYKIIRSLNEFESWLNKQSAQ